MQASSLPCVMGTDGKNNKYLLRIYRGKKRTSYYFSFWSVEKHIAPPVDLRGQTLKLRVIRSALLFFSTSILFLSNFGIS